MVVLRLRTRPAYQIKTAQSKEFTFFMSWAFSAFADLLLLLIGKLFLFMHFGIFAWTFALFHQGYFSLHFAFGRVYSEQVKIHLGITSQKFYFRTFCASELCPVFENTDFRNIAYPLISCRVNQIPVVPFRLILHQYIESVMFSVKFHICN